MPRPTHTVVQAALYDYIKDFMARGAAATDDFRERNKDNPIVNGSVKLGGGQVALQRQLEEKYLAPDTLDKYRQAEGNR